jgi:hypothetical protein
MSDNWLRYVPTDPEFQPSASAATAAEALLRSFVPRADEVRSEFTEDVGFIDPGANWSGVSCPLCGMDAEPWWGDAMSAVAETDFANLEVHAPCCHATVSLNEMRYVPPAAFGRYVLEAMNPGVQGLSEGQTERLSTALGCPVREIPVHI